MAINNLGDENNSHIDVNNNNALREFTGGDIINFREFYDNQHLYGSFKEFIDIKLGISASE